MSDVALGYRYQPAIAGQSLTITKAGSPDIHVLTGTGSDPADNFQGPAFAFGERGPSGEWGNYVGSSAPIAEGFDIYSELEALRFHSILKMFFRSLVTSLDAFVVDCVQMGGLFNDTTAGHPDPIPSAILELRSTTKAFVLPRMTTTQRNAIATPVAGMKIYNTTLSKEQVRTAAAWETVTSI